MVEPLNEDASSVSGLWDLQKAIAAKLAKASAEKSSAQPDDAPQSPMGQSFAQIVAVLMRDPYYKNLKIADLEPLVLPPVMAGQFRLAHGTRRLDGTKEEQRALAFPVGVALWARVSPAVDKGLAENLDKNVWLRAADWTSGDILWLMALAGHARTMPAFLQQLAETEFKGKVVKMRVTEPDGKVTLKTLGQMHTQSS
jgi:hemolysin-activating ACP:hemolysin acyltransferase